MRIINGKAADDIRQRFTDAFIDRSSEYYKTAVRETRLCSDGMCYLGRLWVCFRERNMITEAQAVEAAKEFPRLYIMWDLNSADRITIPGYWKYPKRAVLQITSNELETVLPTLPEDAYVFDEDLKKAIAFTNEKVTKGRYCIYCESK
ncbi:MAG: hypothetical protein IJM18_02905 [Clostridia bacterium]|nr:hypothetical protein [Clostridia bacterium]